MHRTIIGLSLILLAAAELRFTEVPVGYRYGYSQTRNCTAYHSQINYKRAELIIIGDFAKVMWTDYKLDVCNAKALDSCPMSAVVCGSAAGGGNSIVKIGTCVDDLYMYVWDTENAGSELQNVNFIVNYLNTSIACDSVVENNYTTCGAMKFSECDTCEGECRVAACYAKKTLKTQGNMCLPAHTTTEEIKERCQSFAGNGGGNWTRTCDLSVKTGDVGFFYTLLSAFFIIAFVLLCVAVSWYNLLFKKSGREPVHCPNFCPEMLFPRAKVAPQSRDQSVSYQPPEFYTDH